MIDYDTFTKIAEECGRFGQINCCQRLLKVAQSGHTGYEPYKYIEGQMRDVLKIWAQFRHF